MNNKQIIEAINNVRHKMKLDMNNEEIMEVMHDLNILEEKLKEQEQTGNKFRERKKNYAE